MALHRLHWATSRSYKLEDGPFLAIVWKYEPRVGNLSLTNHGGNAWISVDNMIVRDWTQLHRAVFQLSELRKIETPYRYPLTLILSPPSVVCGACQ